MDTILRLADSRDVLAIQALCREEGWTSFAQPDFADALAASIAYVACRDGCVVGYARALTDGHITLFLCELLVAPDSRGQGIGSALMERLHEDFPTTRMDLLSDADAFYEKRGFRRMGGGYRKSWS